MGARHTTTDRKPASGLSVIQALGAIFGMAILLALPHAQAAEPEKPAPEWQGVLALQLKSEYHCDFDKILFHREVPVGDQMSTEGRVRCLDAREVDFTRNNKHEKFTLRLCQPTVC